MQEVHGHACLTRLIVWMQVRHESIARWLQPRSGAVRSLRLRASGDPDVSAAADEEHFRPMAAFELSHIHDFGRCGILCCAMPSQNI